MEIELVKEVLLGYRIGRPKPSRGHANPVRGPNALGRPGLQNSQQYAYEQNRQMATGNDANLTPEWEKIA